MGDSRNVTRRALLGGAAAAGAASIVRPATGLAGALQPRGSVFQRWVGALAGESSQIRAPAEFVLVGVEWSAPAAALIELRAQARSGRWSPWVPASTLGHDPDGAAAAGKRFGEPVWTGAADHVQLRTDRPVEGLRVHFVSAGSPVAGTAASARAIAQPVLDAGPGQPPIIARQGWGAGTARPRHPPTYGTVDVAFVHHTVNPNGYSPSEVPALLRSIFDYHVLVRGFWDIAYNFIIDLYGGIWEGRAGGIDMPVIGAHAGAYNTESTGVAVLGDFMNVVPSAAAIDALEHLLAWKLSLHGVPALGRATVVVNPKSAFYTRFPPGAHVSLPRIAGHRDGDSTDCPGNAFYAQLPSIRPRVAALAGMPAALGFSPPPTTPIGTPVTVSGHLRLLSGEPQAGAPIELQQLQPGGAAVTVGGLTTALDGSWSTVLTLARNTTLRVLHRPHPAAVSDWITVGVAPAITLAVTSTAPIVVSGTISPFKQRVTVALYPAGRTTGKPIATRKVGVSLGHFTATIPAPPPGAYVLIARTQPDAANAAGASPPVPVTVS